VPDVSIRELRNKGGDVVERAAGGEMITITKAGKPVAELRPLPRAGLTAEALIEHRRHLPPVNPVAMRRDIDELVEPGL
jgi:prevent-host-death family protein